MLYLLALGVIGVAVIWRPGAAETLYQCSAEQAATDGHFSCLPDCDENHKANGNKQYCLSYFPDGGDCYMKPYTRQDIMTCNGKVGPNDPPLWFVVIGGSNQYMMLKTMLDVLLNLPANAGYNPTAYWNAQPYEKTGEELYSEMALMDFVWDANHNILRRTAWWWDADCYYCLPSQTESIFLDVPPVTKGSFRVSYINLHLADEFPERFNDVVRPGCNWLSLKPKIHVYMEWSGMWGDEDAPSSVHEANLKHLKTRQANEGLNIASFVFTDSAPDCAGGATGIVTNIKKAFNAVSTSFPKHFFSKQDMQRNHFDNTGTCTRFGGHTLEPMNIVMWQRWVNIMCNPSAPDTTYRANIPACADLGDATNTNTRCFGTGDGRWMGNLMEVCKANYLTVANDPPCELRVVHNRAVKSHQQRRICKLQHISQADTVMDMDGGLATTQSPPRRAQKVGTRRNMRSLFTTTQTLR